MDAATIATIIGAGGLGVLIPQIFSGIRGLLDGRHQREKTEAVDALAQRDAAVRERNAADRAAATEARDRRRVEEYASHLRRLLIERCGLDPEHLPPWPTRTPRPSDDGQDRDHSTD